MKIKPLLIAVSVLAILTGLAWWLTDGRRSGGEEKPLVGKAILSPETLASAAKVELSRGEGGEKLVLFKQGGHWVLPAYYGIPADFERLAGLTESLLEGKVDRHVTSLAERMERLELGQSRVRLFDSDGAHLWGVAIGGVGPAESRFIRFDDQEDAYLTFATIPVDTKLENWVLRRPLGFGDFDVSRIELEAGNRTIAFSRPSPKTPFKGDNLAENEEANAEQVSRLVTILILAEFIGIADPSEENVMQARAAARQVRLELFSGETYTLHIGRRPAFVPHDLDEGTLSLPGPLFIFYESTAPDFVWRNLSDQVALEFPDTLLLELFNRRETLIQTERR